MTIPNNSSTAKDPPRSVLVELESHMRSIARIIDFWDTYSKWGGRDRAIFEINAHVDLTRVRQACDWLDKFADVCGEKGLDPDRYATQLHERLAKARSILKELEASQ